MKPILFIAAFLLSLLAWSCGSTETIVTTTEVRIDTVYVSVPERIDTSKNPPTIAQDSTEIVYVTKDSLIVKIMADPKDKARIRQLYDSLKALNAWITVRVPKDSIIYVSKDTTITNEHTPASKPWYQFLIEFKWIIVSLVGLGIVSIVGYLIFKK